MAGPSTRKRILDAAERLFFVDGIGVTGVDRVAAEAGVAIATLYAHVGSKEGLLEAVLDRRLTAWTAQWQASIEAAGSPRARLLALFDALIDYRSSQDTQWCCFLATASERPRAERASADPVMRLVDADTQALVTRLHRLAADAGVEDPGAIASQLALVYNGALASLLREEPTDPLVVARTIAHALVPDAARE